jgi:uncharacterized membrane protein
MTQTLKSRIADGEKRVQSPNTADRTAASRSITVDASGEELYEIWRDPDSLSEIMGHVADVTPIGEERFRWTIDGPLGREVSWETNIVEKEAGKRLRWQTPPDAMLPNEGSVQFSPASGDRGTVVTLSVSFDPPGGTLGDAALEQLSIVPEAFIGRALDRFKSLVESGEIPTLERNPSGRGKGDLL